MPVGYLTEWGVYWLGTRYTGRGGNLSRTFSICPRAIELLTRGGVTSNGCRSALFVAGTTCAGHGKIAGRGSVTSVAGGCSAVGGIHRSRAATISSPGRMVPSTRPAAQAAGVQLASTTNQREALRAGQPREFRAKRIQQPEPVRAATFSYSRAAPPRAVTPGQSSLRKGEAGRPALLARLPSGLSAQS